MHPTPSKLREECHLIYTNYRCRNTDLQTLKSFFECPMDEELRQSRIRRFNIDKFKPLQNFLRLGINTRDKNVELLAWLIDFKHRPYSNYIDNASKHSTGIGLSNLKVLKTGTIIGNRHQPSVSSNQYMHSKSVMANENKLELVMSAGANYDQPVDFQNSTIKKIILEYPSGVKLKVGVDDLELIAQLVKM